MKRPAGLRVPRRGAHENFFTTENTKAFPKENTKEIFLQRKVQRGYFTKEYTKEDFYKEKYKEGFSQRKYKGGISTKGNTKGIFLQRGIQMKSLYKGKYKAE